MTVKESKPTTLDAEAFRRELDVSELVFDRAVRLALIPAADLVGVRESWTRTVVDAAVADRERIVDECGDWPDYGAFRAAEILEGRFGMEPGSLGAEVLVELARTDAIPHVGHYKGNRLYCGRALERFEDRELLERARVDGRLHQRSGAAVVLGIRDSDFDHLVRARWVEPVTYVRSYYQSRRSAPTVPLYREGDLRVLLEHPGIDWDRVRATPKGRPSPLALLTAKPRTARKDDDR